MSDWQERRRLMGLSTTAPQESSPTPYHECAAQYMQVKYTVVLAVLKALDGLADSRGDVSPVDRKISALEVKVANLTELCRELQKAKVPGDRPIERDFNGEPMFPGKKSHYCMGCSTWIPDDQVRKGLEPDRWIHARRVVELGMAREFGCGPVLRSGLDRADAVMAALKSMPPKEEP